MGVEYLIGLAIATGVVLWAFSALIPKIYNPSSDPAEPNADGYAEKYFKVTAGTLLGPPGN